MGGGGAEDGAKGGVRMRSQNEETGERIKEWK